MNTYKTILFDLDGTLSNTEVGITGCFTKTLKYLGVDCSKMNFKRFIGPPLEESFGKIFGDNPDKINEACAKFREFYGEEFVFKNTIFEGIPSVLNELKALGYTLGVATSKYQKYALIVLEQLKILDKFAFVGGSVPSENRVDKADIIKHLLATYDIDKQSTVLVGDTIYDMRGAMASGIDCLVVLYGFGQELDFEATTPIFFAKTTKDVLNYFASSLQKA